MNKKLYLIFLFCCIQSIAYSQEKFSLNDFLTFSKFSSNEDFENFCGNYHYTLFNSNLAENYAYDELGFITKTNLRKFSRLSNNDSLLFNKYVKIFGDGKRTNQFNNHLSFFKNSDSLLIKFSTTSKVVGYDYFTEFFQECNNKNFKNISCDTAFQLDGVKTSCEFNKGNYSFKFTVQKKTQSNRDNKGKTTINIYDIVFIKNDN